VVLGEPDLVEAELSVHSICSSSRCTTSSWRSHGTAWKKKKVPKRMTELVS